MLGNLRSWKGALLALFILLSFAACTKESGREVSAPAARYPFTVELLSVGKADAIILYTENRTVVVDTGNKGDGKAVLSALEEKGREEIDTLIITHFDKDHVGGAVRILNDIPVGEVIVPDYEGNNDAYERFCEALQNNGVAPVTLTQETAFTFDDAEFILYPALKSAYAEADNDFSIALSVTHGDNTFLFAGDAESERLSELASQADLAHDFLKVPHHGVSESNSRSFLQSVSPKIAVITDSCEEPADQEVVQALQSLGASVYFTKDGAVTLVSDGKEITVLQ